MKNPGRRQQIALLTLKSFVSSYLLRGNGIKDNASIEHRIDVELMQ